MNTATAADEPPRPDPAEETDPPRRARVAALPPDDRRNALVVATLPLLREHGGLVTVRQIADAAGVAEGTIFGVFRDKQELLRACLIRAFDPTPMVENLWKLSRIPDLRQRLIRMVEAVGPHLDENFQLLAIVRSAPGLFGDNDGPRIDLMAARQTMITAIAAAIEPDRDQLRRSPETTAELLLSLIFGRRHSPFGAEGGLDAADLVSLLLDGLLIRNQSMPLPGVRTC